MLLDQLTKPEKTSMRPTIVGPTRYIITTWRYLENPSKHCRHTLHRRERPCVLDTQWIVWTHQKNNIII